MSKSRSTLTQLWMLTLWSSLAPSVKFVIVKACGLLIAGVCHAENACSPLNEGTWLSSISISQTGSSHGGGHTPRRWNALQNCVKNENNPGRRGNPTKEEAGRLDWITCHFEDSAYRHQLHTLGFSGNTGVLQLFLLTQQQADLKQGQTSGFRGAELHQISGDGKFPCGFLNISYAICNSVLLQGSGTFLHY